MSLEGFQYLLPGRLSLLKDLGAALSGGVYADLDVNLVPADPLQPVSVFLRDHRASGHVEVHLVEPYCPAQPYCLLIAFQAGVYFPPPEVGCVPVDFPDLT